MDTRITETLARFRSESGLTQEEVANHLGITKAAVSKWECGQSLPDISLLPAIADLYSTSIDDLFGHAQEPDQESINAAYLNALSLLGKDFEKGIEYVRRQVRENWGCADLLRMMGVALFAQIPTLPGFNDGRLEGDSLLCAKEAERVIRRAIGLSTSEAEGSTELPSLVRILLWTNRVREAEEMLGSRVRKEPNLQATLLAQLYHETGRDEEALVTLQRALLISLLEAQSTMSAMVPIVDDDMLDKLATFAGAMQPNREFAAIFPTLMPTIRFQQAKNRACRADADETLRALELFADALDGTCAVMSNPTNPCIFDKVEEMLWAEDNETASKARTDAVSELQAAYASILDSDRLWEPLRNDERFDRIVAHIAGNLEKR